MKFTLENLITLVLVFCSLGIAWGALNQRVAKVEKQQEEVNTLPQTVARIEQRQVDQGETLKDILARLRSGDGSLSRLRR